MDNGIVDHEAGDKQSMDSNGNADGLVNGDVTDHTNDTNPLLNDSHSVTPSTRISWRARLCGPARIRYVTVEPAMVLFVIAFGTMLFLKGQYIRQQIAFKYGEFSDPGKSASSCGMNVTDGKDTDSKIQAEASQWGIYLSIAEAIPSLVAIPFFGAWSDRVGRKPVMLVPATGMMLACLAHLFVVGLELPLYWFYLGAVIRGASGSVGLFIALCFSYIADITTKEERMFRIVIIDMIFFFGAGLSQIGIGFFLRADGYVPPMLMAECISVLTFFYVLTPCLIPDATPKTRRLLYQDSQTEPKKQSKGHVLKHIANLFNDRTNNRRRNLIIASVAVFMMTPLVFAQMLMVSLYALGEPFCWGSVTLGFFMATDLSVIALGTLLGAKLMSFCLSDMHIVIVAIIDSMLGLAVTAVAQSTAVLFVASIVSFLRGLILPVFKAAVSKMVTEKEQGTLFACFGSIQGFGSLVAPFITNGMYTATVQFYPPFVFYYMIVLLLVPLFLVCFLSFLMKSEEKVEPRNLTTPDSDMEYSAVLNPSIN